MEIQLISCFLFPSWHTSGQVPFSWLVMRSVGVWLLSPVACGKPLVHLVLRRNETTIQFEGTRRELISWKISTIYHKEFSSDVFLSFFNFFQGGGGRKLLTCPCPLTVQARPPRVQRLALLSRVSGQESGGGGGEERNFNMPISTEGSSMPTMRPKTGSPVSGQEGGGGGKREILTCPYPLKVQARPPWDQRPALLSRVSGQEWGGGREKY